MSMLASVGPWDLVAEGYSDTVMRMFADYSDTALNLAGVGPEDAVLDVACGPGTLTLAAAGRARSVAALDFSENMLRALDRRIAEQGLTSVSATHGDGQALPFDDASFDAAFSMFGLMFFPDRAKGYAELYRTLKPGGRACVSSWAPVADSPLLMTMFGAMRAIRPEIPEPKTDIGSLENPEVLAAELRGAGFRDVAVHRVTRGGEFSSAAEYWDFMARGSAPVLMMQANMAEDAWQEKCGLAIDAVEKMAAPFPTRLTADAWLGVGVR